ncbi:diguanylate cyclase [Streptomyces hygroscopicus subsp. hygroscopicus]|uniref:Diguanylate cyclase (GGDEF)-like protein/PAS domain S-box-containing protein n=1 Tax=Streptomyces demainii TaxID=588122 RepID=A0ABT9KLC7_9ACTN|nr:MULTISPECIES: diguanylate cyclase CdgB [Streptomyces]MBW8088397.1 diguanylate cyclase [Streptomyces hygroscopicus subsp. hygroscopicus]MDP9609219.1 diguanylate cyclase (GGDEF)-like protein/PAS domain S-box-containing protein [Streptomyces demainii]
METESEPYIRLATLRQLHQVLADLNTARSFADTLQAVADGVIAGLGFELSAVNLVRPDGDLVVAAVGGSDGAEALLAGRVGSRCSWERRLAMGERWGDLRFIPYSEGWVLDDDDVPQWHATGPAPRFPDEWHPMDRLFAPLYAGGASGGELIGVISVDKPCNGRRPGAWGREALQVYAFHAAVAIGNARLRGNMQRALLRLEREQQALRASEESFRQAFEYAPSGMAIAEMGGDQDGRLLRANDALCRLLGRPASAMRRLSFSDLVHPEDIGTLLRTSAEGGRAELRLARRDRTYVWVSLRNSVVADAADGPRFLLTHVEDIEERKRHELQLAHRASHDSLTGLPNSAELRARLAARLCATPPQPGGGYADETAAPAGDGGVIGGGLYVDAAGHLHGFDEFEFFGTPPPAGGVPFDGHVHAIPPNEDSDADDGHKGLAVLFCDLDGFKSINDRFGHHAGDAVLIEVARRLANGVRDGDTVARLGGDEFVVLADGLGRADAQDLAVRLRNAITPPIRVDGRAVRVGASFGIGWAGCGMSAEEVLHSADQRMYIEKRSRSKERRRAG